MKSSLSTECDIALAKPVEAMTPADLSLLISQGADLGRVVPRSVMVLAENPLIRAQHFRGDLLLHTVRVSSEYWGAHEREWTMLHAIIHEIEEALAELRQNSSGFFNLK